MNIGYHLTDIKKGKIGEISKIQEELDELADARLQGSKIMELIELSDLYGAISLYLSKHHPEVTMDDLSVMSKITHRAFESGNRK